MLTADLAISWQRGGRISPHHVDSADPKFIQEATDLIGIFAEFEGRTRAELEQELQEYVGTGTDYKVMRGLIKLLTDRCDFATAAAADPAAIRRALFTAARAVHPVVGDEAARAEVVGKVAAELGCTSEVVTEGLYADLPGNQKLSAFEPLSPRELLDLYNLAQAQAILYRCQEMRLWIEPQSPGGYRELFGAIKAFRLIHTIKGDAARGYEVQLSGPVSMFHRSQKYGVQMAVFLPALLLCEGWRMRAEIASKPGASSRVYFEMTSDQKQLRSHYESTPGYVTPTIEQLAESWTRFDSPWTLEPGREVIDLGDGAFIPDFVVRHPDGAYFYLEILGFWTPEHLDARMKEFAHSRLKNYLVAAWDELRGTRDPLARIPPHAIVFKKKLDPMSIILAIEKLSAADG